MTSRITFDHIRQARSRWTTRLAEFFLEQLGGHQMFMDIDVIPGVWVSRRISMRQHWAGNPNAAFR
jgi:hypothetical protein